MKYIYLFLLMSFSVSIRAMEIHPDIALTDEEVKAAIISDLDKIQSAIEKMTKVVEHIRAMIEEIKSGKREVLPGFVDAIKRMDTQYMEVEPEPALAQNRASLDRLEAQLIENERNLETMKTTRGLFEVILHQESK